MGHDFPFPLPKHLSTTSTPLTNHCLYMEESDAYKQLYSGFLGDELKLKGHPGFCSVVPPSSYIINKAKKPSADIRVSEDSKFSSLSDLVNTTVESVDDLSYERLHPSGYIGPGSKWDSFKTPSLQKHVVDCRLTTKTLSERPKHKIERLLSFGSASLPHPGLNYDVPPDVPIATIIKKSDNFSACGLDFTYGSKLFLPASYGRPRTFANMTIFDPRGTVLVLPSEVNDAQFSTSEVGKMFVHVQNRRQLTDLINKGMNCLVTCANLGSFALANFPSVNFNPRLFRSKTGVHCFNPEGIKIQVILQMLYYQTTLRLSLFQRCRWIIGSDVVELDQGGDHPT